MALRGAMEETGRDELSVCACRWGWGVRGGVDLNQFFLVKHITNMLGFFKGHRSNKDEQRTFLKRDEPRLYKFIS